MNLYFVDSQSQRSPALLLRIASSKFILIIFNYFQGI